MKRALLWIGLAAAPAIVGPTSTRAADPDVVIGDIDDLSGVYSDVNTNGKVVETVFRVTPRNGIDAILRFDRDTGLLRSSEIRKQFNVSLQRMDSSRCVIHYS